MRKISKIPTKKVTVAAICNWSGTLRLMSVAHVLNGYNGERMGRSVYFGPYQGKVYHFHILRLL